MGDSLHIDPAHWRELPEARVPPLSEEEMNVAGRGLAKAAGRVIGGPPPNILLTIGRHPRVFAPWLAFASQLMPRGTLPRQDTELVILRVAWNCRSRYEWDHHVRIGRRAGLTVADIERVAEGPDTDGWSERQSALLAATDDMHADRMISDATWERLRAHLDDKRLVELCMLIGHYEMLAMTLASLGVQPEAPLSDGR